ncbi:MAG: hypothetical protein VX834_02885 [Myxococcota bacterium]|nr:hypothetical protein [Myxococcota bacterium]
MSRLLQLKDEATRGDGCVGHGGLDVGVRDDGPSWSELECLSLGQYEMKTAPLR